MYRFLFIFIFIPAFLSADSLASIPAQQEPEPGERAWLIRPSYTRFNERNWMEIGIGRINSLYSNEERTYDRFRAASAGFTVGAEMSFAGRQTIIAPKMGIEVCATVFGARVSYAWFMQEDQRNGVVGIEGGFCILSFCYAYVGYNFVKGPRAEEMVPEGVKLSVGFNFHLWPRVIAPPKRLGER